MKILISAIALTATLSMPAMAEKTPVKPVDTCANEVSYAMILYHLDKIEAALAELEASTMPKPVEDENEG